MNAESIAESLDLKRNGTGWRGPCPVCGGSDKSQKFVIRDDGDHVLCSLLCRVRSGHDRPGTESAEVVAGVRDLSPQEKISRQSGKIPRRDRGRALA